MFYYLLYPLREIWFGFNVFRYITFRASMAAITSFLICVILGPYVIDMLRRLKVGQYVRKEHVDGIYDHHKHKEGTPTMGGVLIIMAVLLSTFLWCRPDNDLIILAAGSMVWLGIIGVIDDGIKLRNKSSKGVRAITKLFGQTVFALIVGLFVYRNAAIGTELYIPFMKNAIANLGLFYIVFVFFVIVGTSNAVNLTDGLDGLAIGCVIFISITYSVMSYITGHAAMSEYLQVFYLPGAGELTVFCAALTGAGLGFLWFNCHPATVFMGDTGSLAIGGALATVSVLIKKEVLLFIVGGVLVVETLSVMLQVASCKYRKKRMFLMTPIHHHFQMKGWHESKITVRFWIVAAILAMLSMATLKVR
ncbi:MAG: phospho-N-acetylmuramoyl-pentapeptide-transferase [Candidatus Omnitrophica bacterium]|nr:phospho-N-acetylmuramoyl-pentapeptide-transferase [Candidatus Omnitrophota bacterium]MDD5488022.1 phospho-N-acetylmuramoyl-pentapeptide-transferase [Candidatus Omnitrophota bacterium]